MELTTRSIVFENVISLHFTGNREQSVNYLKAEKKRLEMFNINFYPQISCSKVSLDKNNEYLIEVFSYIPCDENEFKHAKNDFNTIEIKNFGDVRSIEGKGDFDHFNKMAKYFHDTVNENEYKSDIFVYLSKEVTEDIDDLEFIFFTQVK